MTSARLRTPRFRIVIDNGGETAEVDVQTTQADAVRYDLLRSRNKWPNIGDAPILWTTVVAWAALRRLGLHDMPERFDGALDRILSVETLDRDGSPVDDAADEGVGVDPTRAGA